jgi:hypothetical protein
MGEYRKLRLEIDANTVDDVRPREEREVGDRTRVSD